MTIREAGISSGYSAMLMPLLGAATSPGRNGSDALVVTASNAAQNQLLVYTDRRPVGPDGVHAGQGGVSGNAGGIEAKATWSLS